MVKKLMAKVPNSEDDGLIKYLIIKSNENKDDGVFLFFHQSLDTPSEGDLWFIDIDGAKKQATFNYGIGPDDWFDL